MRHILVVDDIEENRGLLEKILTQEGHRVFLAEDGEIALEKLKNLKIDLIMLDYMMPNLNGYQTLCAIKKEPGLRHIPVLMISAANEIEKIVECIAAGAEDYLPKPFNVGILKARVKAMIERVNLREQEHFYQNQLRKKQSEIADKQKMASIGQLSAGIAHELKNPMNFVVNFAELLRDNFDFWVDNMQQGPEDGANNCTKLAQFFKINQENAHKVLFHAQRMDQIIKHMLNMSRNSQQDWQFQDINALIEQALFFAYNAFKSKNSYANLEVIKNFELKEQFLVCTYDLSRSLLNVIDNALHTMSKKLKSLAYKPILELGTKRDGNRILIKIKDNGEGFSQENIDNLFKPFYTTKKNGAGLGLSLTYDVIVNKHGGNMELETKQGEGTEFCLILPVLSMDVIKN